jgi:hypothetical protein
MVLVFGDNPHVRTRMRRALRQKGAHPRMGH